MVTFVELSPSSEEIGNANEVFWEQNSIVIEIQNIVKKYFERLTKSLKVCSSEVSKSKKSISQRSSKNFSSWRKKACNLEQEDVR